MDEMWLAIGAYPGFLCGAVFYGVVGIADDRRGIDTVGAFTSRRLGCTERIARGRVSLCGRHREYRLPAVAVGSRNDRSRDAAQFSLSGRNCADHQDG